MFVNTSETVQVTNKHGLLVPYANPSRKQAITINDIDSESMSSMDRICA